MFLFRWKESGFHGWPVFSKRDTIGRPKRHRCVWGRSTKVLSPLHAFVSRAELYFVGLFFFNVPALCIICLVPPNELSCGNIEMHSKKKKKKKKPSIRAQSFSSILQSLIQMWKRRFFDVLLLIDSILEVDCLAVTVVYLKIVSQNRKENNIWAHEIDEKINTVRKKSSIQAVRDQRNNH